MAPSPSTVLCHYRYDPLDRLAGTQPAAQDSALRFYRKNRLATQIQGAIQHTFFGQDDQLLAQQQRSGKSTETRLLATDQQGSVLHGVGGAGTGSRAYNAYGHHPAESGLSCLMGFNGEQRDPVTGHYLLGNGYRAFNPVLMRFNSPDELSPFGRGGFNAYAYCQGDPVNFRDRTGRMPLPIIKIGGAGDDVIYTALGISARSMQVDVQSAEYLNLYLKLQDESASIIAPQSLSPVFSSAEPSTSARAVIAGNLSVESAPPSRTVQRNPILKAMTRIESYRKKKRVNDSLPSIFSIAKRKLLGLRQHVIDLRMVRKYHRERYVFSGSVEGVNFKAYHRVRAELVRGKRVLASYEKIFENAHADRRRAL